MTPEEVTYLGVLLVSVPIGFAFKGRGPRARQFGGAAVGGAVTLLTCGPHALHSLVTVLGTWGLLRLLPRRCGGAAMLWTFGFLLFFRTTTFWGVPEPPPYANALQLLLTLKMVSMASDVQELLEAGPKAGEEPIGRLESVPGLVEILCYSYCYLGLLTGPFFRLSTFRDWVQGPLPPPSWPRALWGARWAPLWGALGEAAAWLCPPATLRDPAFGARPLALRLAAMAPLFLAFRARFYVAWASAEAACVAAGLGAYPAHCKPRPGEGPTRPWPRPRRAEDVPPGSWDFVTVRSVTPGDIERCRGVAGALRGWNRPVQWWLWRYVHRGGPQRHPALRSAWTMLVSAFWHGLHPGVYLSFLSVPLWLAAERAVGGALGALRRFGGPLGGAVGGLLARAPPGLLPMRVFEYLSVGFVLREAGATLRYWGSVYFCLHLLPVAILLLAALGGGEPQNRGETPPGEKGGEGGGREEEGGPTAGINTPGREEEEEGGEVRKRRGSPQPGGPEISGGGTPNPGDPNIHGGATPISPEPQY